jgi:DNA-binding response OmpR family regulator
LVKPFSIEELILKIEVFLKRSKKTESSSQKYRVGKLTLILKLYAAKS